MIRIICQEVTQEEVEHAGVDEPTTIEDKVKVLWEKSFDRFNCDNLGDICQQLLDGEPVFIFRAKDKFSPGVIRDYRDNNQLSFSKKVKDRIKLALQSINEWRKNNKEKIKVPD